jgi:hypothetical protein
MGDIHYVNIGDWVESCTAVIENDDGELEVINWLEVEAAEPVIEPVAGQLGVAV